MPGETTGNSFWFSGEKMRLFGMGHTENMPPAETPFTDTEIDLNNLSSLAWFVKSAFYGDSA